MDILSERSIKKESIEINKVITKEEVPKQINVLEQPSYTGIQKKQPKNFSINIQNLMEVHKEAERRLKKTKNSSEMEEVLSSIVQFRKMLDYTIKPIEGENKEEETKRMIEILSFYAEVVLEKCSNYMMVKNPGTDKGKRRYDMVNLLFKTTYYLKKILGNQILFRQNLDKPYFYSKDNNDEMKVGDFLKSKSVAMAGEDFTDLKNVNGKLTITFKNGKSGELNNFDSNFEHQYAGAILAKYLGINNTVTDYHQITVKEKDDNSYTTYKFKNLNAGNTLGELKKKHDSLKFSKEAYEQLFRIQIMDILTGTTRDPNNLEVECERSKETYGNSTMLVKNIIGDGETIQFSTRRDMNLDSFKFNTIDPKIILYLKGLNTNETLINSLGLSGEVLDAFKFRLSALIQKIDQVTQSRGYKNRIKSSNLFDEMNWEYGNDSFINKLKLNEDNTSVLDKNKFNEERDMTKNLSKLNDSQLKTGLFNSREIKRSNKPGWGRSLLSKLGHIGSYIVGLPSLIIKKGVSFIAGGFAKLTNVGSKDIVKDRIPGKLNIDDSILETQEMRDKAATGEDTQDVIDDTRMLPLAYEESVPIGEDEPPYISLKIDQPKEGSDQTMNGSAMGHVMIEIEYSRLDKMSGKKQRFRSRFGFYPKGGFSDENSSLAMVSNGMVIPGAILNDKNHSYHIGRRFRATNKQINKMILFTNDYAQNGGYNFVTRSCSTFAVEALNHVGIETHDLLQKDKIDIKNENKVIMAMDAVIPLSVPFSLYTNFGQRKKGQKDDESYQRVGQKMLTQKEYERLFVTHHEEFKGYTPAFLAENIRAFHTDDDNDVILSRNTNFAERMHMSQINDMVSNGSEYYISFLKDVFKDEIDSVVLDHIGDNLWNFCDKLNNELYRLHTISSLNTIKSVDTRKEIIKELSQILSTMGQFVSKTYNVTLKRDERANIETHHLISNIETFKDKLISEYSTVKFEILTSEQNDMEKVFGSSTFEVFENGAEKSKHAKYNLIELTALSEVYGDYKSAIPDIIRYEELKKKRNATEADGKEFSKLHRRMELVKPFVKAHTYYIKNKSLVRQFANMAFFSIPKISEGISFKIETQGAYIPGLVKGFNKPAQFYQSIAFRKIFSEKLPDKSKFSIDNPSDYMNQFDEMADRMISLKKEEFDYILEASFKRNPEITREEFCDNIQNSLFDSFLRSELGKEFDKQFSKKKEEKESPDPFMDVFINKNITLDRLKQRVGIFYDRKQAN